MAFHQLGIDEASKEKTAFAVPFGLFEYNRLAMGLKNSPATFQRTIGKIIAKIKHLGIDAFMDDLIVATKTIEEHVYALHMLYAALRKYNLKLKPEKSEVAMTEICYLGHHISQNGLKPDPSKVEKILNLRAPTNLKELQSVLGAFNFYRNYFRNYSEMIKYLLELTRKGVTWNWTQKCEQSFRNILKAFASNPILSHYEDDADYEIRTDASDKTIAAVLVKIKNGEKTVVRYESMSLKGHQLNWHINRKEFYAVNYALCKSLMLYIYGKHVNVYCDSMAVKNILGYIKVILPVTRKWK
ncbi:enzymatic polyprotein endonuclease reverse-like protein [Leptotrombidium deliense]|uniref:RNA-directed DNA polymerase n=1 Tax=Leptotrombidium deliense TaxID=299467 RepID=A0A443RVB7_9ACAR|nr:enzymatic polyprotein endonuclease reverse-like protein [Leptotrombidium deliense]